MKFSNLYPKTNIGYKIPEYPEVKKSKFIMNCEICGDITRWYDKKAQRFICSKQCLEKARKTCKDIKN